MISTDDASAGASVDEVKATTAAELDGAALAVADLAESTTISPG